MSDGGNDMSDVVSVLLGYGSRAVFTKMLMGAVAVAASVTVSAVTVSAAARPSWQIIKQVPGGSFAEFTAIIAIGRSGGWAFDGQGGANAWERNGSAWSKVPFPSKSDEEVSAVAASSPADVWAFTSTIFGGSSRALRWNGSSWRVVGSFPRAVGSAVVLGPSDVWAFGQPYAPFAQLGAWHYNGHSWAAVPGGQGLGGGSAVSAGDIWAYAGTDVARWNGTSWTRASVAGLLPAPDGMNDPAVTAVYAVSADNVYAIGAGQYSDGGGPTVVLHYNGSTWSRVASGNYGETGQVGQAVCADGQGGLWIPIPGYGGNLSYLLHYSGGHLTDVSFHASTLDILSVSQIPGGTSVLAGGFTHPANNPGINPVAVIAEYAPR
jgi:hypothetical protein